MRTRSARRGSPGNSGGKSNPEDSRYRYTALSGAAPHFLGNLHHQLQLPALVVGGDAVAEMRAREPALRGKAQVLQRHELRRRLDAPLELVLGLELRLLGADEAQHHLLPLRHEAQRLEAARALGVVLEKESVHGG